jgi:hypothetical protein
MKRRDPIEDGQFRKKFQQMPTLDLNAPDLFSNPPQQKSAAEESAPKPSPEKKSIVRRDTNPNHTNAAGEGTSFDVSLLNTALIEASKKTRG